MDVAYGQPMRVLNLCDVTVRWAVCKGSQIAQNNPSKQTALSTDNSLFAPWNPREISGFLSEADENWVIVSYYVASNRNFLPIFRCQESKKPKLLTIEDGTDRLSRNVGKKLPLYNA
jgi:hypothetical protein